MTAAAERAVTFGSCFYRWTARLLSCLGLSAAQGIGGRVRTPAPTGGGELEAALSLGGGARVKRAPSSVWPNGQPPSPLEGEGCRAAQCAAPTKYGKLSGLSVGAGSRPDGGRTLCAPTAENGPGSLARQSQAQKWNRISPNFPPTQAPSGAGRHRTQALLILRAGRILPASRGNPRKWGTGERRL